MSLTDPDRRITALEVLVKQQNERIAEMESKIGEQGHLVEHLVGTIKTIDRIIQVLPGPRP